MLEFMVRPDFADFKAASWLALRRKFISHRIIICAVVLTAMVTGLEFLRDACECGFDQSSNRLGIHLITGLKFAIAICGGVTLLHVIALLAMARKSFEEWGTIEEDTTYSLSEAEFNSDGPSGSTHLEWARFTHWMLDSKVLLFFRTWQTFYIVPLDQLDTYTKQRLIEVVKASGVKRY